MEKHRASHELHAAWSKKAGRSIGWAGDVVVRHKIACAFYGLTDTGNNERTASGES
ncbi:hypothetical protein [Vibrio harveyi]|uniref:hypothetical protein n=1 Tax=Vibrio harveyi TaxID=669 RepID=UPI003BB80F79